MEAVLVLTTWPAEPPVAAFARALIDERLAACVNVLPAMQSFYRWEGAIEQAAEQQLVIKTTAAHVGPLTARITALHPYEVPEILVLPIASGGQAYLAWVAASVG